MSIYKPAVSLATLAWALVAAPALAQSAAPGQGSPPHQTDSAAEATDSNYGDIIVTAQKRAQRLSDVPVSISAASAETLTNVGVSDTSDLAKIAPGFTATSTYTGTPVYTIRGVGYYDSALAATPAVSVYTDQVPLSYPALTRNAVFDLERVEVLKGPQGTLFGLNSTGGAINYIAAKPTRQFKAGLNVSAGNFGLLNADGFVSGPLGDTVSARIAVGHDSRGNWQRSYTRPTDERGKIDIWKGRLLIDWHPSDGIDFLFSASGWVDKSDTPGVQFLGPTPNLPPSPLLIAYPVAPRQARAADWTPGFRKNRDDSFYQLSLRADIELSSAVTLTSITSYADAKLDTATDADGTALRVDDILDAGKIRTLNQELRLQGEFARTKLIVGANFADDRISQQTVGIIGQSSTSLNTSLPGLPVERILLVADQQVRTIAGFANIEQGLTDTLTLQAGIRYTKDKREFQGCLRDVNGRLGPSLEFLANVILRPALGIPGAISIPPGGCVSLDAQLRPGIVNARLSEDNISFRFGPSWKVTPDTLLYANVSKGFKAGTFPIVGGISGSQFNPTTQESVLAFEGGFKTAFANRRVQLSGAIFYYDYKNKQFLGITPDPVFGPLQKLVNVPKSRLYGAEVQFLAEPVEGLNLSLGVTYVNSKVTGSFVNFNPYGTAFDFKGEAFPFTPEWQAVADAQYTFPVSTTLKAFVGGNVLYNSSTVGAFGAKVPYNPNEPQHRNPFGQFPAVPVVSGLLNIDSYALLDLRAGVETTDGKLRLTVWGRNVTDKYYWTNATFIPTDVTVRHAGLPASFGATLQIRLGT